MLDDKFNPWVIEVNLSPACREREPFLTNMLDDMAFDLVNWLERKILTNSMPESEGVLNDQLRMKRNLFMRQGLFFERHHNLNLPEFYAENQLKNKYIRLPQSIEEVRAFNISN